MTQSLFIWIGIFSCLAGSAICSGLTLGFFSLGRVRLQLLAQQGDVFANKILKVREDSNFLLATLLWSNVAVNVLLTLLSEKQMVGLLAFFFSLFGITLFGELLPQAYFSRNALKMGAKFSPIVYFLQFIFYPLAKPSALLLDRIVGKEGITWFKEHELETLIQIHAQSPDSDISGVEGHGASNFLNLDDIPAFEEGSPLHPQSIIQLPMRENKIQFPATAPIVSDQFVQQVHASKEKWVVITDEEHVPQLVLDADGFLRELLVENRYKPLRHCHRPIILHHTHIPLGELLTQFKVNPEHLEDDVIDHDLVLIWTTEHKRIITGADILGRLLRGIATRNPLVNFY
jgi:CBS domain containing-hemolysin-like protein